MKLRTASFAAILLAAAPTTAPTAELQLGQRSYAYTVIDQDLRDVLRQFGANTGLRVTVSDAVQGRVRGRGISLPPVDFLDRLAREFGFDWYYDGHTLSVTANSESVTKMVPLGGASLDALQSSLASLGIADDHFTLRLAQTDMVLVAGPPRYVDLVEQTAQTLAKPASPPSTTSNVTIFRGSATQQVQTKGE